MGIQVLTTYGSDILGILGIHSIDLGLGLSYISAVAGTLTGLSYIDDWGRLE
jgi:hypothetical protein